MSNVSRGIVCRHYFQVIRHSKIAGFHIQMIPSRWYTNEKRDNDVITEACCFMNQEFAKNKIPAPNPSTISKTVTCVLCRAAQKNSNMVNCGDLHDRQLNSLSRMIIIV